MPWRRASPFHASGSARLRAFLEARLGRGRAKRPTATASWRSTAPCRRAARRVAFIEELERAGPFGNGNPAPVFAFPAHRIAFADRAGNGHVRISLASEAGGSLKALAFRAADKPLGRALLAARGKPLHVAGTLCLDHLERHRPPAAPHPRRRRARRPLLSGVNLAEN